MSTAPAIKQPASRWIISPLADLALVIAAPLAIVPLVSWATQHFSPELIFVVVASFASIGHHLPGFMRAYGDRELFARFRWRFLLAPPIFLAVAALFSVNGLHGLELLLLFWATWHVLMQTYGLMRIYDLKNGSADKLGARFDFIACIAVFACGIVFSQSRVYTILEIAARVGLPLDGPQLLSAVQWTLGISTGVFLLAYAARVVWQMKGQGPSWAKISLLLTTGWLYWICGVLSTNILIGVAMFEIFHALQYYAVVWSYNRRLADRAGSKFGPLRFMFVRGWLPLLLYIVAIAAFGSLRWVSDSLDASSIKTLLLTLLVASVGLHFYYDGFIWKVRERDTQQNLDIHTQAAARNDISGRLHAGKWALLGAMVVGLFVMERYGATSKDSSTNDRQLVADLKRWTPDVPELLVRDSQWSLSEGQTTSAVAAAQHAADLRPRSAEAQAALGSALLKAGKYEQAADALNKAVDLRPKMWENHFDLGQALRELQRYDEADHHFELAAELNPQRADIQTAWAENCSRHGDLPSAMQHDRAALRLAPDSLPQRTALVQRLIQAGEKDEAIRVAEDGIDASSSAARWLLATQAQVAKRDFQAASDAAERAVKLDPKSAEANYQLGAARLQLGDLPTAELRLRQAVTLRNTHALAHFQLGNVFMLSQRETQAEQSFRNSIQLAPDSPDAHNNLGALLMSQDRLADAKREFQAALKVAPNNANSHYNLGLIALSEQDMPLARQHLARAEKLGQPLSAELRTAAGMD